MTNTWQTYSQATKYMHIAQKLATCSDEQNTQTEDRQERRATHGVEDYNQHPTCVSDLDAF